MRSTLAVNDINLLNIYNILFADDIALFTTNAQSLRAQLNALYDYSTKWGLKVNVAKTKICVFEKRNQPHNFNFNLYGENIETVDILNKKSLVILFGGILHQHNAICHSDCILR